MSGYYTGSSEEEECTYVGNYPDDPEEEEYSRSYSWEEEEECKLEDEDQ